MICEGIEAMPMYQIINVQLVSTVEIWLQTELDQAAATMMIQYHEQYQHKYDGTTLFHQQQIQSYGC